MATFPYPHSFTPNTAAKSTEVNSNFNAVKTFTEGIAAGTNIDTGAIVESKIGTGAVTEGKIANGSVTKDKIGAAAVDATKIDYITAVASGGVPRVVVSATEPTSPTPKAGDVWIQI